MIRKKFINMLVLLILTLGLIQLGDLSFYLMNQPDTYIFNIGLIAFILLIVSFIYIVLYLVKVFNSEEDNQINK